jgi:soluble lytic murein transglycosylase
MNGAKQLKKVARLASFGIACCLPAILLLTSPAAFASQVQSPLVEQYRVQRDVYNTLTDWIEHNRLAAASERSAELNGYPLQYFFEYLLLRKRIQTHDDPFKFLSAIERFQSNWQNPRLQRRLYGVVKSRAATLERWKDYPRLLKLNNAPDHPCDDLYARVSNKLIGKFDQAAVDVWVKPVVHHGSCDQAFDQLIKSGSVPVRALWQRSRGLIRSGHYDEVREMYPFFSRRDRDRLENWIEARGNPAVSLPRMSVAKDELDSKIMPDLLARWARRDLAAAFDYWLARGRSHGFSTSAVQDTLRRYAVRAAKNSHPRAEQMLAAVDADQAVRFWRIRLALRDGNWRRSLDRLDELTPDEQRSSRWRYWRARTLDNLGYSAAAKREFGELSQLVEYHGFLAADQIGSPYPLVASMPAVGDEHRQQLLQLRDLRRAIEFFLVGTGWEGRRLWNAALKDASPDTWLAASQIATSVGWSDRALHAMRKAGQPNALDALFPTPYREEIQLAAANYSLEQALVYGLIRQESAFIADIRSSAGAIGLMQLMPATAKEMAGKLGLKVPRWRLIDHRINIQLGTKYLQYVLDRFEDNTVLAMAAYNAGPHRVSNWLGSQALPADVWVESIPFDETRKYVKNVLFNTTMTEWRLQKGRTTRLSSRMPIIDPAS